MKVNFSELSTEKPKADRKQLVFLISQGEGNNMIGRLTGHLNIKGVRRIGRLLSHDAGKALCKRILSTAANIDVKAALLMSKLEKKVDVTQSPEGRKMLAGDWYTFSDPVLTQARDRAKILYGAYNRTGAWQQEARKQILEKLLGGVGQGVSIRPPFHCDYGFNTYLGAQVDINFACVILDCGEVIIGDKTLIGPNVQIYTVGHPKDPFKRTTGIERAWQIRIGNNVWIGGDVDILSGVRIGDNAIIGVGSVLTTGVRIGENTIIGAGSVVATKVTIGENTHIGAGSVVTKDIPANVVAVGNPCEVIKDLRKT